MKGDFPDTPGVYFFVGEKKDILYIGKATSLKSRVKSYFSHDIAQTRGPKIVRMLDLAREVTWQTTDSVLEALLLEAQLIKKHQPPYNTDEKDDKSFYTVIITKEAFPRVLLVREREREKHNKEEQIRYSFGPFPQGGAVKEALKIIRKIFPFRDGCVPRSGKPCFNVQIGLCPGVCAGKMTTKEYAQTIRHIVLFFEGKKVSLMKRLEKEMKAYAKQLAFEKAAVIKKQLFALQHIQDVSLLKREIPRKEEHFFRIEAYDVAHLSGSDVVGVMTVVENGVSQTSEYRRFKLTIDTNDDPGNLAEILTRRWKHTNWRMPDMIVVDGSIAQRNAALRVLDAFDATIPIVGVVKDAHHKPKSIEGDALLIKKHHNAILVANAEAHRYAIAFHRFRRGKSFIVQK